MINTPAAIAYGWISLIAAFFSAMLFALSLNRLKDSDGGEDRGVGFALVLALGQAVLVLRLVSWPMLYAMFASYVGLIRGSMCIYGVTQSVPGLTHTLELLEPAAFLVAGVTLILLSMYRSGSQTVGGRTVLIHMALAAALSLAASLAGLGFMSTPKDTHEVSCCSAVTDTAAARGAPVGQALPPELERFVVPLAQSCALALLLVQLWQLYRPTPKKSVLAGVIACVHVCIALEALFGPIAPALTGMRDHHCAYCLVSPRFAPHGIGFVALALFALANVCPMWLAWSEVLSGEHDEESLRLRVTGVVSVVGFWAIVFGALSLVARP